MLTHEFKLKPSITYISFLSLFVFASLIVVSVLTLDFKVKSIIFIIVAFYGANIIWRYGFLKGRDAVIALRPVPEKSWIVTTPQQRYDATLIADSTVTPFLSVLRFKVEGRYFALNCTLLRDSLPPDEYRQLVVLAKHQ